MDTKSDKLGKDVDRIFPIVDKLLEVEQCSSAAAFLISGKIMTSAVLTLNVTPENFELVLAELVKDYRRLYEKKNDRKD